MGLTMALKKCVCPAQGVERKCSVTEDKLKHSRTIGTGGGERVLVLEVKYIGIFKVLDSV